MTSVETPFALHNGTPTLGVVEWNGSVPLVEDVSITEFVDAVEVLLRLNATLDDALLVELFVVVGKLASSVEATEADILVETAESLAYLSSRVLEQGGVRSVATLDGAAMEAAVLAGRPPRRLEHSHTTSGVRHS